MAKRFRLSFDFFTFHNLFLRFDSTFPDRYSPDPTSMKNLTSFVPAFDHRFLPRLGSA